MNFQDYSYITDIIGKPVQNSLGEEYGKVSDIIISAAHRRAVALVVQKGGFLGIGADYFVLPWDKVQVNPNTKRVMVEADRKTIEDAPLVELEKVRAGDAETLNLIFGYYGIDAFWQQPDEEAETPHQNYEAGDDVGERLPENEGSHQITQHYPGQRESHPRQETNYDKMKGLREGDKNQ